jgi:antitoxin (DNA-binding transcriptional repressor) of toxin-antitoxin stability system
MAERTILTSARDAVHNFTHYAAMVDAGAEVIITRRGRAPLKLVRAEPAVAAKNREALVQRALSIRSAKPFKGKFVRSEAYDE